MRKYLIFLVMLCLLSISAVSAQEIDNNTIDDTTVIIENDKTFTDLNAQITSSSGNLTLDDDYTYTNTLDSSYKEGIIIDKNININGNNHKIDCNNLARAFYVNNGVTLKLTNITLINGFSAGNGGVIYNLGTIIVSDSQFENNTANYGGVIDMNSGSSTTLLNSNFTNNKAIKDSGVIRNNGGTLDIFNCQFLDNSAAYSGLMHGTNCVTVIINSIIKNSKSNFDGGAISMDGAKLNVSNCTFLNNKANHYGGAIYISNNSIVYVDSSLFEDNDVSVSGGAIGCDKSKLYISNSTFNNNSGVFSGGAVFNAIGSEMKFYNSTFESNKVLQDRGGAIRASGILNVSDCKFIDNQGAHGGGGIAFLYNGTGEVANAVIYNSKFVNNTANDGSSIYVLGKDTNVKIENNSYIFNKNQAPIHVTRSAIINSNTTIVILNNETKYVYFGDKLNFTAVVIIDNVPVTGYTLQYLFNGNTLNSVGLSNGTYIFFDYKVNFIGEKLINGSINGNPEITTAKTALFVSKYASDLQLAAEDVVYGNNVTVIATVNPEVDGNVTFIVENKNITITLVDGKAVLNIKKPNVGNYTIKAIFNGNEEYYGSSAESNFKVTKASTSLSIDCNNITYGDNATIIASVTPGVDGNVTFIVGAINQTIAVVDGKAVLNINKPNVGNYTVKAIFNGNNNYNSSTKSNDFNVIKAPTNIKVTANDILKGQDVFVEATVDPKVTGTITFDVDGILKVSQIINGKANTTFSNLSIGSYTVSVTFNGNSNYDISTNSTNFQVTDNSIIITADNISLYYRNGTRLVVEVKDSQNNPLNNIQIYIRINDIVYSRITDENGSAFLSINLIPGKYVANVFYNGTEYPKTSINTTINVISNIYGNDVVKYYRNGTQYYAHLLDNNGNPLANASVKFNIHGIFYEAVTDANGVAHLDINLNPGKYLLTAIAPNGLKCSNTITVLPTLFDNYDLVKYFRNDSQYSVKVLDNNGLALKNTTINFNINGIFYNKTTDENGIATLNINLNPGKYVITTIAPNGLKCSNNVTVLKTIEANDISMSASNRVPFKAEILDGNGNPLEGADVSFNINGIIYHKTTNSDGLASLNINLNPGEYIITTSFNGLNESNKITIKN